MHRGSMLSRLIWVICLGVACSIVSQARAAGPDTLPAIHGEIVSVDGLRVVRVSGDAGERGFAEGYLMAKEIIGMIDGYLSAEKISGGPRRFEAMARNLDHIMTVPSPYMVEIDGMLAGIEKRLDGETKIARLGRELTRRDLVAINCVPDAVGFGCSSFVAWGERTHDGNTISGRNLDWHVVEALRDTQIVVAQIPSADSKQAAWVSITWPGLIGCLTGMNQDGVTVAMHDAFVGTAKHDIELTPRGLALRAAVEAARSPNIESDILRVLTGHRVLVGNIVPISFPRVDGNDPAIVFEYDGHRSRSKGVTVRHWSDGPVHDKAPAHYEIATNHYRQRGAPEACGRYATLDRGLSQATGDAALSVKDAWDLLQSVSQSGPGLITYQSVVFEPNAKRMHVSLSTKDAAAPNGKRITLDVARLLEQPVGALAAGM